MTPRQREFVEHARAGHVAGTSDEVRKALDELVGETGADEVLVTASGYDADRLRDSLRRLAELAEL